MSSDHYLPEPAVGPVPGEQGVAGVTPLPDRIERLGLLAQTLLINPSWNDLARLLVLRIFDGWRCGGAVMFAPLADGSLALQTSYGYTDLQLRSLTTVPLEHDAPLHRAMTTDEVVWFPELIDVIEATGRLPLALPDSNGLIVAPLTRLGIPLMVVVLSFRDELPSNPASGPFVAAIKSLLELHLGQGELRRADGHAGGPGDTASAAPAHSSEVILSARQLQVLRLLAQVKTNRSIALDLGYSESTIRQETLRLYRALNVNSRSDAVSAAMAIGLISPAE